jgi:hypothetical protein
MCVLVSYFCWFLSNWCSATHVRCVCAQAASGAPTRGATAARPTTAACASSTAAAASATRPAAASSPKAAAGDASATAAASSARYAARAGHLTLTPPPWGLRLCGCGRFLFLLLFLLLLEFFRLLLLLFPCFRCLMSLLLLRRSCLFCKNPSTSCNFTNSNSTPTPSSSPPSPPPPPAGPRVHQKCARPHGEVLRARRREALQPRGQRYRQHLHQSRAGQGRVVPRPQRRHPRRCACHHNAFRHTPSSTTLK